MGDATLPVSRPRVIRFARVVMISSARHKRWMHARLPSHLWLFGVDHSICICLHMLGYDVSVSPCFHCLLPCFIVRRLEKYGRSSRSGAITQFKLPNVIVHREDGLSL